MFIETRPIATYQLADGGELRVTAYGDVFLLSIVVANGNLHTVKLTRTELLAAFGETYFGILGREIAERERRAVQEIDTSNWGTVQCHTCGHAMRTHDQLGRDGTADACRECACEEFETAPAL